MSEWNFKRIRKLNFYICYCADTFQALIQYPDVVTAQAAKLVRFSIRFFCFVFKHAIWRCELNCAFLDLDAGRTEYLQFLLHAAHRIF